MKKGVLGNFTGKHLWFAKFSKTPFLQNTPGQLFLAFSCNATKMGYCQQYLKKLRWIFITQKHLPQPSEERCSVEKGVLKDFVNFIGKHLFWSLYLIKLQAYHLFLRTSANFCQYLRTALAPLTVTYPFYFIFSTFFLITATTDNISDVCFWFKFKRLQRI